MVRRDHADLVRLDRTAAGRRFPALDAGDRDTRLWRLAGWVFALAVTVLGSVGISLGRFLRWNSWDVLQEPLPILHDLWDILRYPFSNLRIYGFTLLYTLLFLFVYLALRAFGHLQAEGGKPEPCSRVPREHAHAPTIICTPASRRTDGTAGGDVPPGGRAGHSGDRLQRALGCRPV